MQFIIIHYADPRMDVIDMNTVHLIEISRFDVSIQSGHRHTSFTSDAIDFKEFFEFLNGNRRTFTFYEVEEE